MVVVDDSSATTLFWLLLFVLAAACVVIVQRVRSKSSQSSNSKDASAGAYTDDFKSFQRNFLLVWFLASFADWMQGPYVYNLYRHYGYDYATIAWLFVVGFGSSMVFGTVVASLADKYGRKMNCIAFGVIYGLGCLTKHSSDLSTLVMGRVLSGIATSILASVFEAWMVHEHRARQFDEEWLSHTFSQMTFVSGIAAIVGSLVAGALASVFDTPVAPFDGSCAILVVTSLLVASTWTENYGIATATQTSNFRSAFQAILGDERVALVGLVQAGFEAGMYIFVFQWSPALELAFGEDMPHGVAFACFMVCIMIGSYAFKLAHETRSVEDSLPTVLGLATVALLLPILTTVGLVSGTLNATIAGVVAMNCFCVFEVCCGCYFPSIGTLRGKHISEHSRATTMNLIRVALNLIVVGVLMNANCLGLQGALIAGCICIAASCGGMVRLQQVSRHSGEASHDDDDGTA